MPKKDKKFTTVADMRKVLDQLPDTHILLIALSIDDLERLRELDDITWLYLNRPSAEEIEESLNDPGILLTIDTEYYAMA